MRELRIKSEEDTERLAREIADKLRPGDVLALVGDLGSGKTTLTKYIAKELGIKEEVTSPTFIIVNEYTSGKFPLYHFDAYRLKDEAEALAMGMDEYFSGNGVCIIEWADLVAGILPDDVMAVFMETLSESGERVYRCTF